MRRKDAGYKSGKQRFSTNSTRNRLPKNSETYKSVFCSQFFTISILRKSWGGNNETHYTIYLMSNYHYN